MAVGETDPYFWLGYLVAALEIIARDSPNEQIQRDAARSVREYRSAPLLGRDTVAFAVMDATGECYAIRDTREEIDKAHAHAVEYLFDAATCGHPRAPLWVRERTPLAILTITEEERIEIMEDGTPVLDREP